MKGAIAGLFAGLACALALCAGSASAATYTFSATGTGWVGADGSNNGSYATNNYFAGYCTASTCGAPGQEYRDFFLFDTSGLAGAVTSATLRINLYDVSTAPSSTLNLLLTSLTGTNFSQLGTGTVYGAFSGSVGGAYQWVDISLSAASFAQLASGSFGIGGRITNLAGDTDQYLFGISGASQADYVPMQLLVSTSPVPEPETWALLGLGLAGAVAQTVRRKRSGATKVAAV
jgi:hypothetical protein